MSGCEYPYLSARTAYRKGCRCPVCTRQNRVDSRRWNKNRSAQCFEGGLSQAVIDEWARRTWQAMNDKEQRTVREILT